MALTSKRLLMLAVVVAVSVFTVTVWLWPRLARRSVPAVLGRIGILLGTQLSILAAGGVAANLYFGFYSSWADLLGTEQEMGVVVDHDGTGTGRLVVRGTRSVGLPDGGDPGKAGRVDRVTITGESTGITASAYVYLPPQYFRSRHAGRKFPAALVLTGFPGTAENLITRLRYPQTAARLIERGTMRPTVLVLARPTVAPPRDTECMDVPGGPQAETFFTEDLRRAVAEHYRVGGRARNWGVIGNSTGGYCALKMALRRPGAFSAAAGLSNAYRAPSDATTGDLFGGSRKLERENDLLWRLAHRPMPPVSVLLGTSRSGEDNYADARAFIARAKRPLRVSSIVLESGGHNFSTWSREVPPALDWLTRRLRVPGPGD
ncbi:alpha/beta hydrolase-fold protein [Streptomyces sp. NPDC002055]|uniref:alpha/beta hydrolase n=1 Tax=Streptomyces sp. NPDC002055 TaxID=3154534 RepID=UPI003327983F